VSKTQDVHAAVEAELRFDALLDATAPAADVSVSAVCCSGANGYRELFGRLGGASSEVAGLSPNVGMRGECKRSARPRGA
jgi:hypothetical protein